MKTLYARFCSRIHSVSWDSLKVPLSPWRTLAQVFVLYGEEADGTATRISSIPGVSTCNTYIWNWYGGRLTRVTYFWQSSRTTPKSVKVSKSLGNPTYEFVLDDGVKTVFISSCGTNGSIDHQTSTMPTLSRPCYYDIENHLCKTRVAVSESDFRWTW